MAAREAAPLLRGKSTRLPPRTNDDLSQNDSCFSKELAPLCLCRSRAETCSPALSGDGLPIFITLALCGDLWGVVRSFAL